VGRGEELFERERGGDPDLQVWDGCALACNKRRDVTREITQLATRTADFEPPHTPRVRRTPRRHWLRC
jgi:hypothetical protein